MLSRHYKNTHKSQLAIICGSKKEVSRPEELSKIVLTGQHYHSFQFQELGELTHAQQCLISDLNRSFHVVFLEKSTPL